MQRRSARPFASPGRLCKGSRIERRLAPGAVPAEVRRAIRLDALCVALIALLSAVPYVGGLGFYSDDWGILAGFHSEAQAGRSGLAAVLNGFGPRPVQGLYLALQFKAFGLDPLGYHLVNSAVLALSFPVLYLLLWRLGARRADAFAACIVVIVLPQLSTVRAWTAASQIPLSMLFALASLHAQWSFSRSKKLGLLALAVVTALLSLAAYEIFAPILAAFPVGLAALHWRGRGGDWRRAALPLLAVVAAVVVAVLAKSAVSDRGQLPADAGMYWQGLIQLVRPDYDWRFDSGLNIFAAAVAHFWHPLAGWAQSAARLASGAFDPVGLAAAGAIAGLAVWRLRRTDARDDGMGPRSLFLLGAAAFLLGHATFLIVPAILFTPTGMGNRVLVAAALGAALIMVALVRTAAQVAGPKWGKTGFGAAIGLVALLGAGRVAEVAGFWVDAARVQERTLAVAARDLRAVPAGSTVILDGVCPYRGPGVVFETWWDVGGALSLALGRAVRGDAVSPRMALAPSGLRTSIYGAPRLYPYGPSLFVYNPDLHLVAPLPDLATARSYFGRTDRRPGPCPVGYVGRGQPI